MFFYQTNQYLKTTQAVNEAETLIKKDNIINLFNDRIAMKKFKEEIFPAIRLAQYLKIPDIRFCGSENNAIDAELKNDDIITNVECTTSINAFYKELVSEYNKNFGSCFIGPHSQACLIDNIEEAKDGDIVYSGSRNKRQFIRQEDINDENSFESCLIDVNKYIKNDIDIIQKKIDKGIKENKYKNYVLVLSCEHNLVIEELPEYKILMKQAWENIEKNPFSSLFVVNYDDLLAHQCTRNSILNPSWIPIPIFYFQNTNNLV